MGFSMAGHLSNNKNLSVFVHNRSKEKTASWLKKHKGNIHNENAKYDFIILCVGKDEDVLENLHPKNGLLNCLNANGVIVDHTTTSAELSKKISADLQKINFNYLDAPVSGGESGAINGKLSCMIGGDNDSFLRSESILKNYCNNIIHIGKSGSGQISKMANQLCIAGTLAGLSEAIYLLEKSEINAQKVFQAIRGGAAQSWQLDNRFETMVEGKFDFGFAIEHMIKDLTYALEEINKQGWNPKIGNLVVENYKKLLREGCSQKDTSVLIENYRDNVK